MLGWILDRWYLALPRESRTVGAVARVAGAGGALAALEVEAGGGSGERPGEPVRVGNWNALLALAGGNEARALAAGVQVGVHLDLARDGLPDGSLLTIGAVVLRVVEGWTPDQRTRVVLGVRAARRLGRHARRGLGGRVLLCAVVAGGTIRSGDKLFAKTVGIRFQP